jgi:glycine/D-amino acid oxidase-like deaminating enzyme
LERRWAGDVLVVGAGASGLIIAQRFVDAGLSVTIVERGSVGGEQSNHSHGYMHRGHIYLTPSLELVRNLSNGADRWRAEMDALDIHPINDEASLLFTNAYEADVAAAAWSRAGLTFHEDEGAPPGVRQEGLSTSFVTQEATFDFTEWLRARYERLATDPAVTVIQAEVTRLEREGATIVGAVVSLGGEEVRLASSFVVLCGGIGNLQLAATVTQFRGNALNRSSPMLVLRGPDLPSLSAVFHGHETHGMFIASRHTEEGLVWLVSNYVSYAGEAITSTALRLWLRDIRRTLRERTNGLEDPRTVWGYYSAPKGELRNIRTSINSHNVQSYGLDNLLVAAPTKLTLTPLLGDVVMEEVAQRLRRHKRPAGARDLEAGRPIPVSPERWTDAVLHPLSSLLEI